jgi:hypothetical protein
MMHTPPPLDKKIIQPFTFYHIFYRACRQFFFTLLF